MIKRIFNFILLTILFFFMYSIGGSIYEHIQMNEKVNEFKARAISEATYEVTQFGDPYVYHPVKRVHDYELNDARNVFYDTEKVNPGMKGDILLAFDSPFPYVPVVHQMLSFWLGGHAALVVDNNRIVQSTGLGSSGLLDFGTMIDVILHRGYDEVDPYHVTVSKTTNYWIKPYGIADNSSYSYGKYYRPEIFAVRTKAPIGDIDIAVEYAEDKIGKGLYNYLFIFDTQYKYYCTDLVTRSYAHINSVKETNYNLDKDGFVPSDYDILLSNDVYITIYKETIDDVIHIYYLEDI